MRVLRRVLAIWSLFVSLAWPAVAAAQQTSIPVEELQRGGYVLLFQHAHVEVTPENQPLDPNDCAAQRALTAKGKSDAVAIGAALRRLKVPIGPVLVSPYCRTRETAQLAFGRFEQSEPLLHNAHQQPPGAAPVPDFQARLEATRRLIATPPPPGTNTVLITHGGNVLRLAGTESEFGGFFLYRPDGRGGVEKVAISARWFSNGIRADAAVSDRYIFTPSDLVALAGGEAALRPNTLPASGSSVQGMEGVLLLAAALLSIGGMLRSKRG